MRALLTGRNGTVGGALSAALAARGVEVVAYPRGERPLDDPVAVRDTLAAVEPHVVFHLAIASRPTGLANEGWRINVEWPTRLAECCAAAGIRLVFTSTVMVFSDAARGPFAIDSTPDRADGYGYEKRIAEQRVRAAHPAAAVVRLGWQIGAAPGGNQMLSYFDQQSQQHGVVRASTRWLPACSFLEDSAAALLRAAEMPGGLYQFDSNRRWSFFEIAGALNRRAGNAWRIEPTSDFVYDQRMLDERLIAPPLDIRLPELSPP
ncbi:MAG: sugar nucleotide-binding protein [Phycisphaerae bacterium]